MAVKAMDSTTIYDYTDVTNVRTWYKTVSRSSAAPTVASNATESQMTTNGWGTTEPGVDTTKKLYTVHECMFGDGTYVWGDVSLSSSYEAAIEAYNESQNAKKVATNYVTDETNGILVHPQGDSANGVKITNQVDIIRTGNSVAMFGESARIGKIDSDKIELSPGNLLIKTINGEDAINIEAYGEQVTKSVYKILEEIGQDPYIGSQETSTYEIDVSELQTGDTFDIYIRTLGKTPSGTIWSLDFWNADDTTITFTVSSTTQNETISLDFPIDWTMPAEIFTPPQWITVSQNVTVVYNPTQSTISITAPNYVESNSRIEKAVLEFFEYSYIGQTIVPRIELGGSTYLDISAYEDIGPIDGDIWSYINYFLGWGDYVLIE